MTIVLAAILTPAASMLAVTTLANALRRTLRDGEPIQVQEVLLGLVSGVALIPATLWAA